MRLRGVLRGARALHARIALFYLLATLSAYAFSSAGAQQPPPPDSTKPTVKLRIFLDCGFCDFDFMRTEIAFVDYVRDRQDAQVHILVTNQQTGGGGTECTLHFIRQPELANLATTLAYLLPTTSNPTALGNCLAQK